jgi:hypothetical protein
VAAPASTAYYGPRFDYDPVTLAPKGLLIEEQRTQLLLRSEEFDNAAWSKTALTVTANAAVSPDGSATADKLIPTTATTTSRFVNADLSITVSLVYTQSVYAKAAGYSVLQITGSTGFGTVHQNFDLDAGTLGGTNGGTATITPVGNGWFRCTYTLPATSTTPAGRMLFAIVPNANSGRLAEFTGDGVSGAFLWGAQLEVGSFATSYIPSVASQVTRAADNASMIGNNFARWYNQTEGSFFASMDYMSATTTAWVLAAHSGGATNTNDYLAFVKSSGAAHRQTIVASGAAQGNLDVSGAVAGVVYKYAGCYKVNDAAFTVGGATPLTDNTVTLPVPNSLQLGNLFNQWLNGHVYRIAYFNRRLANSEIQGITS